MNYSIRFTLTILQITLVFFETRAQRNPVPTPRHHFTVIAHRGDHVKYPENTLAAYQEAIKSGADYVEIDLRTTKDSVLVSMHDGSVTRMTGQPGNIKDLSFAQLQQLKVKSSDPADTSSYRIPTFKDILETCKDKIYIYLDFKDASVAAAYTALCKYHMEKQVIVYINSLQQFDDWRRNAPKMPLMLSLPDSVKNVNDIKTFVQQFKPDVLDGNWNAYTPEILKYLGDAHIPAWPDIQSADEHKYWDDALKLGFTGLQTDHPAAFITHLTQKGLR
jgi:glycerophosphoryl diester phosphodiesterase